MANFMHTSDISLPTDENSHTPTNSNPKRKSGRRSWFSGKPTHFEIAVEPIKLENQENEVEYLELTHFSAQPKIDFGCLKVGKSVTRTLIVHNPHEYEQQVVVEKFPTKKDFGVDLVEFSVDTGDAVHLSLTWSPSDSMRCREMVIFRVDEAYRLQAILLGNAEQPPKPQKRRGMAKRGRKVGPGFANTTDRSVRQVLGEKSLNSSSNSMVLKTKSETLDQWSEPIKPVIDSSHLLYQAPYHEKLLMPDDPSLNDLQDTPTRRATFVKDDPLLSTTPVNSTTFHKDGPVIPDTPTGTYQKVDPTLPDTPARRTTFQKDDPLLPDTPSRRTTFLKDDPNLPVTPIRRETFLKQFPAFKHPDTHTLDDLEGAARRLSCIPGEDDDELDTPRSSSLRRSLTYTKLNVSNSPPSASQASPGSPDYQNEKLLSRPEEIEEPEEIKVLSRASSRYFTPLTTPLETPHGSDSEDDCIYQDSVMYLTDDEPMTPDPGHSTIVESSVQEVYLDVTAHREVTVNPLINIIDGVVPSDGVVRGDVFEVTEVITEVCETYTEIVEEVQEEIHFQYGMSGFESTPLPKVLISREATFSHTKTCLSTQKETSVTKEECDSVSIDSLDVDCPRLVKQQRTSLPEELTGVISDVKIDKKTSNDAYSSAATKEKRSTKSSAAAAVQHFNIEINHEVVQEHLDVMQKVAVSETGVDQVALPETGVDQVALSETGVNQVTVSETGADQVAVSETGVDQVAVDESHSWSQTGYTSSEVRKRSGDSVMWQQGDNRSIPVGALSGQDHRLEISPKDHRLEISPKDHRLEISPKDHRLEISPKDHRLEISPKDHRLEISPKDHRLEISPKDHRLEISPKDHRLEISPRMLLDESFSHKQVLDQLETVKMELQHRLSSTPMVEPRRLNPSDKLSTYSTALSQGMLTVPSPISGRVSSDTVTKQKPSLMLASQALLDPQLKEAIPKPKSSSTNKNSTEPKRQLFGKPSIQGEPTRLLDNEVCVVKEHVQQGYHGNTFTVDHVTHCQHHDGQHTSLKSTIESQIGEISPNSKPSHQGVPLLLKHDVSSAGKKRPLSADRQSALARLAAPTESSRKRVKSEKDVTKVRPPSVASPALDRDRKMTRTMQLRRQAAMNSMKKSESKSKKSASRAKSPPKTGKELSISRSKPANSSTNKKPVKGVAQAKLILVRNNKTTALPKHPLPFAAKNVYYDERWMEKQEKGFVLWLNFILTPPEEFHSASNTRQKVDAGKLCVDVLSRETVKLAPTKEVLSFKVYSARRRMNHLRRSACMLYQSDSMITVIDKLEREVELGRIQIRKDRKIHADLGIRQKLLDTLLCFNPLWLRVGMETIFGEIIPMHSNTDVITLSRFIVTRLLGNPDIAQKYAHPTVPHLYRNGYYEELAKFTLKKFLLLVLLLDRAKRSRLIDHDPCLFCKDAEFKASRDLLLTFSKDYLSGEGDLTKHLGYFGYSVTHSQTVLDEFDFSVSNLATDLRCGLRLTRVMELLTQSWELSQQLRVPAIGRLQKVHNVGLALKTLTSRGISLDASRGGTIDARAIVDGHREKTLQLLWLIIFNFQIDMLISESQLREEITFLTDNLKYKNNLANLLHEAEHCGTPDRRHSMDPDMYLRNECLSLLLRWCRAVCAHYDLKIDNFTVSFSDGRVLCCLLHHYHPSLLPLNRVNMQTTLTFQDDNCDDDVYDSDDSFDKWNNKFSQRTIAPGVFERLLSNEKENFKLLYDGLLELGGIPIMLKSMDMSNTIPDEKVVITFVMYLCARLLDLRQEVRAARVIQAAWRRHWLHKQTHVIQRQVQAACIIQNAVRQFLNRKALSKKHQAALMIQCCWRRTLARRVLQKGVYQKLLRKQSIAACCIQRYVRRFLGRRHEQRLIQAAIMLQAVWRGRVARQHIAKQNAAARIIQRYYRALKCGQNQRSRFLIQKQSVIRIQRVIRRFLSRSLRKKETSAVMIQAMYKMYRQKHSYQLLRRKATTIAAFYKMVLQRTAFCAKKQAALVIQRRFQAIALARKQRREFLKLKNSAVIVQRCYRHKLAARQQLSLAATITIQTWFRSLQAKHQYHAKRTATMTIQRLYRSKMAAKKQLMQYHVYRGATITIQSWVRRFLIQRRLKKMNAAALLLQTSLRRFHTQKWFVRTKNASVTIQRWWRSVMEMRMIKSQYSETKSKVIKVQAMVRMYQARKQYLRSRKAAISIQAMVRMYQARKQFLRSRKAAISIQAMVRMYQARKQFLRSRKAAISIQAMVRMYQARKQFLRSRKAAISIQAMVRMYQARKQFLRSRKAAISIQAMVRMYQARKQYLRSRKAAISIQAMVRMYQARKQFLRSRKAAISIQAMVRMYQARKQFLRSRKAAISIQAMVRMYQARKQYLRSRKAAISIQAMVRMYQARKQFLRSRKAAISIQAMVRMYQARKQFLRSRKAAIPIQAMVRMYQARKQYLRSRKAAISIQAMVRMYQARKQFLRSRKAAISIQAMVRMYQARKQYLRSRKAAVSIQAMYNMYVTRCHFMRLCQAAVTIQCRYRAKKLSQHAMQTYKQKKQATVLIQSAFRGYLARKYANHFRAATLIQASWKGYKQRKIYNLMKSAAIKIQSFVRMHQQKQKFQALKRSVSVIQMRWRATLTAQLQHRWYCIMHLAAVTIQTACRGWLQRRAYQRDVHAVVNIQAAIRGYLTRKRVEKWNTSAEIIQRHFRAHCAMKTARREYAAIKQAVIIMQSMWKRHEQRKRYNQLRTAAVRIQSCVRRHQTQVQYQVLRQAAIIIQTRWRATMIARRQHCEYYVTLGATVCIQAAIRGWLHRRAYKNNLRAVVCIQAAVKGYLVRKQVAKMESAARIIQTHYRAHYEMQQVRTDYCSMKKACITIQSLIRMKQAENLLIKHKAARTVQSVYRLYKARAAFITSRNAAITIQSAIRRHFAMHAYSQKLRAVHLLQKYWRATVLMKQTRRQYLFKQHAAVVLQTMFRGYRQQNQYKSIKSGFTRLQALVRCHIQQKKFRAVVRAVSRLQVGYRAYVARQQAQRSYHILRGAVITIQSTWRGVIARRRVQRLRAAISIQKQWKMMRVRLEYNRQQSGAIVLQSHVRRLLVRRRYLRMKEAATIIQRRLRATLLARGVHTYYKIMIQAAVLIQTAYRALLARRRVQFIRAAVIIQKQWRMYTSRRDFFQTRAAAILLQGQVRKVIQRRSYLRICSATRFIQQKWRATMLTKLQRNQFLIKCGAAMTIQAYYRGVHQRRCYLTMKRGFIRLQALTRMNAQRSTYVKQKRAAICIQSHIRSTFAQITLRQQKRAVVVLQMRVRATLWMMKERRNYHLLRGAAITIQAAYKGHRQRQAYLKVQRGVIALQALVRCSQQRDLYVKQVNAIVRCQQIYRAKLQGRRVRQLYLQTKNATIKIQSVFRMFRQRQSYLKLKKGFTLLQSMVKCRQQRASYCNLRAAVSLCQQIYRAKLQGRKDLTAYQDTKSSAIRIQSLFRMFRERSRYLRDRRSVVLLQSHTRGLLARRRYMRTTGAAVCIQRTWRATLLMRQAKNHYHLTIGATIIIQSACRCHCERTRFLAVKQGIVRLQAIVRGRQQRRDYLKITRAACLVQRQFRVYRKRRSFHLEYERTCAACVTLQAYFRGFIVRKRARKVQAAVSIQSSWRMYQERKRYSSLQEATLCVQKNYRRHVAIQRYKKTKQATVTIQKYFRTFIKGRKVRNDFMEQRQAAICIQTYYQMYCQRKIFISTRCRVIKVQAIYRGWLERRRHSVRIQRHRAATIIQNTYRRYREKRQQEEQKQRRVVYVERYTHVIKRHLAVIHLQRTWRRRQILVRAAHKMEAVLYIQRWIRARLQRIHYLRLLASVHTLQRVARTYLAGRKKAAIVIQTAVQTWLVARQEARRHRAATTIQALWHGFTLRRSVKDKKIRAARRRVEKATANATEDRKLCNRTRSALDYLLHCKQLSLVLEAVMNLDVATRLSPKCCEWMVQEEAQCVLFQLIRGCNRSLPHMEIIKYSVNIFLNLVKYVKTRAAVYAVEDSIDTLVDLMAIYREKGTIFNRTCTLLGLLCNDPVRRREILAKTKIVEKLQSIHALTARKHKINERRTVIQSKIAASKTVGFLVPKLTPSNNHRIRPAWCAKRDSLCEIEDPFHAINFVLANLTLNV